MKLFSNETLDERLASTNLCYKLAEIVQHRKPCSDGIRQLIWRWASNNVYYRTYKQYRQVDNDYRFYKNTAWYNLENDTVMERIILFLEFIRDYRDRKGEIPHPAVALTAYHMRFVWIEKMRKAREMGIELTMSQARIAVECEKYLNGTDDVDAAVSRYMAHIKARHDDWLHNPNCKRRTAPPYPTPNMEKLFRERLLKYMQVKEMMVQSPTALETETDQWLRLM